ncbi:Carbamoyl-phosphate synthase small chain [Planctomycetes bacterium Pan216]|uniref:Carbamoyl phosphate synthase small chain n=1 Tax=Kolteria novifilia TaxID=2527975 RepID=A0A518B886_9BACT|nr:Carbamoyl-phosphate synthase small chain [Planctomycetes bacterium Pan216]
MAVAKLALEDGTVLTGESFGAEGETLGEAVFNTSMTGYQEILTDPSYHGQIVTMTYPQIGNYGVNRDDVESPRPFLSGFVVRELAKRPSNYRHDQRLEDYLAEHGVIGVQGIDTRTLVLRIRRQGAMKSILSTVDLDDASLVAKARESRGLVGRDLAREVMTEGVSQWTTQSGEWQFIKPSGSTAESGAPYRVVALDFGMKWNIARCLSESGCAVTVVPGTTPVDEILALEPDGIFVSNGPGDPEPVTYGVETLQKLMGEVPIFGICLGHQLLALSLGAKTFKLKFGHRGANQPVLNQRSGRVEITTQNHGFAVDAATLPSEVEATHINLNDQTLEGLRHKTLPVFSVQYHPEASSGPHDSAYLFGEFIEMMDAARKRDMTCRGNAR